MSSGTVPASHAWNKGLRQLAVQAGAGKRSGATDRAVLGPAEAEAVGAQQVSQRVPSTHAPQTTNLRDGRGRDLQKQSAQRGRCNTREKVAGNQHGLQVKKVVSGHKY